MFLGGKIRSFPDDQPLDKTYVAFHGNYINDGKLIKASANRLKTWIATHSDGKANPDLVEQWGNIEIPNGVTYFYHPQASVPASPQRVLLCQGNEDPKTRLQQCAKPELGDALANGILTTPKIVQMNTSTEKGKP